MSDQSYILPGSHVTYLALLQAPVIFGAVTIFGIVSWYFVPEDKWLRRDVVLKGLQEAGGEDAVQELNRDGNLVNADDGYDAKKKL